MIRLSAFADEAGITLDKQIEALNRNKISLIELRNVDGVNVSEWTEEMAERIYKKLKASNISVWSIGSPLGKVSVDIDMNKYTEQCRRIFKIANIMHTDKVRIFSFFNAYDKKQKVIENLKKLVKIAKEYNVTLYHENEKEIYGDIVDRVIEILDNVEGIKNIYDPANYIQCKQNIKEALAILQKRTDYYHIKDIVQQTGEIVPSGFGDGCIKEMIQNITTDKVLTIEPHLKLFEGYKSIDATPLKNSFVFKSCEESFDCAVSSLKKLLKESGFVEDVNGDFYESKVDN